jgi:hypothetical protein
MGTIYVEFEFSYRCSIRVNLKCGAKVRKKNSFLPVCYFLVASILLKFGSSKHRKLYFINFEVE